VIWPRVEEAFWDLGIVGPFEEASKPFRGAAVYANGRRLGELRTGRVPSAYPYPMVIEQHDTERLLAERLETLGVRVEWDTEATDVRPFGDRVEVDLRRADGTKETAASGWVVGCEGTRSMVREGLGIPFEGARRPNLQVLQVNATPKNWPYPYREDRGYFFLAPGVSLGGFPLPVGGYRFFASVLLLRDPLRVGDCPIRPPALGALPRTPVFRLARRWWRGISLLARGGIGGLLDGGGLRFRRLLGGRRGGVPLGVGRDGSGGVEPELYERDSARHQDQGQRKQEGTRDA
jgi:2-polyprenyl-6-methoxyphenol hydroxylase-like FAD-dependent oxidoreductase